MYEYVSSSWFLLRLVLCACAGQNTDTGWKAQVAWSTVSLWEHILVTTHPWQMTAWCSVGETMIPVQSSAYWRQWWVTLLKRGDSKTWLNEVAKRNLPKTRHHSLYILRIQTTSLEKMRNGRRAGSVIEWVKLLLSCVSEFLCIFALFVRVCCW